MRKFIPSFILAFALAVSFLVPVRSVFAIGDVSNLRASVFTLRATKTQTSNYSYTCPKVALAQLSFFTRLLAAIGITQSLPTQKLAESTVGCGDWGVIAQKIDSKWGCTMRFRKYSAGNNTVECVDDDYRKDDKKTFGSAYAAKYGVTSCTTDHIYKTDFNKVGIFSVIINLCQGPKAPPSSTTKVTYPPDVDIAGIGSFRGRLLFGNLIEDFSVTESGQTVLAVWDRFGVQWPGSTTFKFRVPIQVALTQLVLNPKTNEFNYVSVPCTKITVAGKALDKNCQMAFEIYGTGQIDVTPKAPAPYYIYSVFVNGAITEITEK